MSSITDEKTVTEEIARLEIQPTAARAQLNHSPPPPPASDSHPAFPPNGLPSHALLLLSDSALPLGSFAFSNGLESYLAHHPFPANPKAASEAFSHFLTLALTTLATTTLPYLLAAHRSPKQLPELDATLDACTLCPVARRASVAQGKALLTLWERALRTGAGDSPAALALAQFSLEMRKTPLHCDNDDELSGHFAPIWAAVTCAMGITLHESTYTFLFNHAKAVVSAAVRASVMGPYAAQGVLASGWLRGQIEDLMAKNWDVGIDDAAQGVPMCDLWLGRHELLYSRIFNS
ncbi:hypothetical protein HO133_000358 [Letharia lupina]|uniref:Urease accessory protein UreF n=1 Tax=Letharia lupina TaxID=560253 RepID=A0A8H6CH72_9LECA|nr:uncharacterized protein HO133_000358 [Letharia lupina]KAF6223515.1 hypothetical protein HO133_000358 [Letharia lupina]